MPARDSSPATTITIWAMFTGLVTLDTPHAGASLANLIVSMAANSLVFNAIGPLITGVASIFNAPGQVDAGAICDLSENSPALQGLNGGTNLKSQVVTGTGGPAGTPLSRHHTFRQWKES